MPAFDVDALRAEFPALAREQDGRPVVFLDGPGGTQVPQRVIDAVARLLPRHERQLGRGVHDEPADATRWPTRPTPRSPTSSGRRSPDEIKFGDNMSTLTLHIGRSIGATLRPGDEIVVTTPRPRGQRLDLAGDGGRSRRDRPDRRHRPDDVTLDLEDLESKLGAADEARRGRLCQQRGRHGQPGRARSSPGPTRSAR